MKATVLASLATALLVTCQVSAMPPRVDNNQQLVPAQPNNQQMMINDAISAEKKQVEAQPSFSTNQSNSELDAAFELEKSDDDNVDEMSFKKEQEQNVAVLKPLLMRLYAKLHPNAADTMEPSDYLKMLEVVQNAQVKTPETELTGLSLRYLGGNIRISVNKVATRHAIQSILQLSSMQCYGRFLNPKSPINVGEIMSFGAKSLMKAPEFFRATLKVCKNMFSNLPSSVPFRLAIMIFDKKTGKLVDYHSFEDSLYYPPPRHDISTYSNIQAINNNGPLVFQVRVHVDRNIWIPLESVTFDLADAIISSASTVTPISYDDLQNEYASKLSLKYGTDLVPGTENYIRASAIYHGEPFLSAIQAQTSPKKNMQLQDYDQLLSSLENGKIRVPFQGKVFSYAEFFFEVYRLTRPQFNEGVTGILLHADKLKLKKIINEMCHSHGFKRNCISMKDVRLIKRDPSDDYYIKIYHQTSDEIQFVLRPEDSGNFELTAKVYPWSAATPHEPLVFESIDLDMPKHFAAELRKRSSDNVNELNGPYESAE